MVSASVVAFALVILALLVLLLSLSQRQRRLTPRLPTKPLRPALAEQLRKLQESGKYRGVRIESRCEASSHLAGRVFEFDTTPALPTTNCEAVVCECSYVGLPERRKAQERRSWTDRRGAVRPDSVDRRSQRPRRKADLAIWAAHGRLQP